MSFWRRQRIKAAIKVLQWQYEKTGAASPQPSELEKQAEALVDKAGEIAQRTGRNIISIVKDLVRDLKTR